MRRSILWFRRAVEMGNSGSSLELGQIMLALGRAAEALSCFEAVGEGESDAVIEAARAWAAGIPGGLRTTSPA